VGVAPNLDQVNWSNLRHHQTPTPALPTRGREKDA
jgi:hypothetical protein